VRLLATAQKCYHRQTDSIFVLIMFDAPSLHESGGETYFMSVGTNLSVSAPCCLRRMTMLPAQVAFLTASKAVLGMASESGLWVAAKLQPGTGIQAR